MKSCVDGGSSDFAWCSVEQWAGEMNRIDGFHVDLSGLNMIELG